MSLESEPKSDFQLNNKRLSIRSQIIHLKENTPHDKFMIERIFSHHTQRSFDKISHNILRKMYRIL